MSARRFFKAGVVGVLALAVVFIGPAPASAVVAQDDQVVPLVHLEVGGGQVLTVNIYITANDGATTVNVKCFNDVFQRIGPVAGVNVQLQDQQQASHTPLTFQAAQDPLFTSKVGWCWLDGNSDFTVQVIIGVTSDTSPGGILRAADSTFVASDSGLIETSSNRGGIPHWTTESGWSYFAILVAPRPFAVTLTLKLFNSSGVQQGSDLIRALVARDLEVVPIPAAWGLATPPTTGSVQITVAAPVQGYAGWLIGLQFSTGKATLEAIQLDESNDSELSSGDAP